MSARSHALGLLLGALTRLVQLLSWRALAPSGAALGRIVSSLLRIRRGAVRAAMRRAGVADVAGEADAMYRGLGQGVLELLWLAGASPARRDEALGTVVLDPELDEALRSACARGPVVLAASHTANWELVAYGAARVLAARGRSLAVVAKPLSVGVFDAFCTKLRTACGLVLIAPEGALGEARRRLAAGDVVAMPIDQVPERARHGVSVPFLGAPALADRAPAALARAAGATLLVVAAAREDRGHRVHLLATLAPPPRTRPPGVWIAHATRASTRALEAFVRQEPSSWLWLHRRWRAPLELRAGGEAATRLVATGVPG